MDLTTPPDSTASSAVSRYGSTPFLSQPRAQSTLRQQLAAIEARLGSELARRRADDADSTFEMHVIPNRVIARLGDAGLSFSWVVAMGGEVAAVSEGRLLVIQWAGVAKETRGVAALRSARAVRERVYRPDGVDADHWCWRVDDGDAAGQATCTTEALVAEWLATSSMPEPV